jgi:hypothetical protein
MFPVFGKMIIRPWHFLRVLLKNGMYRFALWENAALSTMDMYRKSRFGKDL